MLPVRRLSLRCVGTLLEALMTPLLLLWSCAAQYAVILPTTLRGLRAQPSPPVSSSHSSFSTAPQEAPAAAPEADHSVSTAEEPLLWARHPLVFSVLFGAVYGALFLLSVVHFVRVASVDNCPDAHPRDCEAAAAGSDGGGDEDEEHTEEEGMLSSRATRRRQEPFPQCPKCGGVKPERCHHCSQCKRCCLKMDHHCPWMGNCVGFYNYKFFVNFLLWVSLLCLFVIIEALPYPFVLMYKGETSSSAHIHALHITLLGVMAIAMLLSAGFLLKSHIEFTLVNTTTLECHGDECRAEPTMYGPYDLGRRNNWRQVFGTRPILWFLPVFTSLGDGYTYPKSPNYRGDEDDERADTDDTHMH